MDIMSIFLDNPQMGFHVREVARKLKKSPTTISAKLKSLQKEGLLLQEKKFNYLFFRANSENPLYKEYKLFYNVLTIRRSGVIECLEDFYNHPAAVILFGSFRKAENLPESDLDLCVITAKKDQPDLKKYEKKLNHEIQLFLYSQAEFKALQKKNPELLNNFINGIVLSGYIEVFG